MQQTFAILILINIEKVLPLIFYISRSRKMLTITKMEFQAKHIVLARTFTVVSPK